MTAPDPLAEATRLLGLPAKWDNPIEITSAATALALLGIAPLLRELVEQQKLANVIAAFQSRAIRSDADYEKALATVRGLLELPTEEP